VTLGASPGPTWTTYSAPVTVANNQTLYAQATAPGLTDSPGLAENYWYTRPELGRPPGKYRN